MKSKALLVNFSILAIALCFGAVNVLAAEQVTQNQQQNQEQNQGEETMNQEQNQEQEQEQEQEQAKSLVSAKKGQINAQEHRSAVANFVQGLLKVADREPGGIGEQVRIVAQQQNQSASATIQAMERVQTRSSMQTFFFGSDYKNLGALRSEMVQTRNRIEQLNRIMANLENEEDRTELQNQLQTMEEQQLRIEEFVRAEENRFSLFGWFVKMFQRQ